MNDTNLVAQLVALLAAQKAIIAPVIPAGQNNTLLIVGMIIAALSPILAALSAYFAKTAVINTEQTKKAGEASAVSMEKIHVAVNSERTATLLEIKVLKEEILKLTEKAARKEGAEEERKMASKS